MPDRTTQALDDAPATEAMAEEMGLSPWEFARIQSLLGRVPNFTELSVFSVMWSEHCSYKNSRIWLKTLPQTGEHVLAAAGEENAGLLAIGNGQAVAFKIESHNHPSAVEPFQGAATGVGGIHRDIFTLGARPIATLNSLRFGDEDSPRTRQLVNGVVQGISFYGNAFGIPTVGGELYFDRAYNTNPLVNVMSVGVVDQGATVGSKASGPGNPVWIVGAATGKDGIHGASFASADLEEDSSENLPSVQVGDPFTQKKLLEACLESVAQGLVVAMQDMGAAGITSSTAEMAAKGDVGLDVHLDRVPLRQTNMRPFEILLSESQERMLIIGRPDQADQLKAIFDKWDLECAQIGSVAEAPRLRYFWQGECVVDLPPHTLAAGEGAPEYDQPTQRPSYFDAIDAFSAETVQEPSDCQAVAAYLIAHANIASKTPLTQQYDSMVGAANLRTNWPGDAAALQLLGTDQALVMTTDCNAYYVYLDPRRGAQLAVAEAARNIVCAGAKPIGVTNCLNFGNPHNPEVYYQFVEAVKGMGEACERFGLPVTGGNVSLYNHKADGNPVFPTPTIGMVGLLSAPGQKLLPQCFQQAGDSIWLLGKPEVGLAGSAYLSYWHGIRHAPAPPVDLEAEAALQALMLQLSEQRLLNSAHDLSEGGLAVALLESAIPWQRGFDVTVPVQSRLDAALFGEAGGRILVSLPAGQEGALEQYADAQRDPLQRLGTVTDGACRINRSDWGAIQAWQARHEQGLAQALQAS